MHGLRLPALVVIAALALAAVAAGPAAAKPKKKDGAPAAVCPAKSKKGKAISMTSQVYCWVANDRKTQGLFAYARNKKLSKAARQHSARMEKRNIFNHTFDGAVFDRISKTGYFKRAKFFAVGEAQTWARSARGIFDNWMASAYHRGLIRSATFRDYGIGVVKGAPFAGKRGGYTATAVFARRM